MTRSSVSRWVALGLAGLVAVAAGWSLLNKYSTPRRYAEFLRPAQRFLQAALDRDSIAVSLLSSTQEAATWALTTGRENPLLLRTLLDRLGVVDGRQAGENTLVLFRSANFRNCSTVPLALTFRSSAAAPLVAEAIVQCPLDR